jgi:uncharacterized protein (DUF302 family)
MRILLMAVISVMFFVPQVYAAKGVVNVKSSHSVKKTADRLESILKKKGMTVFIRINHAEGAKKIGRELRPTELLIFGNPKVGTKLMQCSQSIGLDLPLKALVWESEGGQVWLTYNDPIYLAYRHGIAECGGVIKKVENALKNFAKVATTP